LFEIKLDSSVFLRVKIDLHSFLLCYKKDNSNHHGLDRSLAYNGLDRTLDKEQPHK